jgi:hypothetical protein
MVKKSKKQKKGAKAGNPFTGPQTKNIRIGTYEMSLISTTGSLLPTWEENQHSVASIMVAAVMLAQIRSYNSGVPTSELDALPSVKHIKKFITQSVFTKALVAILAVGATIDYVDGSQPQDLEREVIAFYERFQGNSRHIESISATNVVPYRLGLMSQALGWLQSCPISNMTMLGLDPKTVGAWSLEDTLNKIGFGGRDQVVNILVSELIGNSSLSFDEPRLPSETEYNGLTRIEHGVFGTNLSRTQAVDVKTAVGFGGIVQAGSMNSKILQSQLSLIELSQYNAAAKNGNQEKLRQLTDLAKQRYEQAQVASGKISAIGDLTPSAPSLTAAMSSIKVNKNSTKAALLAAIGQTNSAIPPVLATSNVKATLFAVFTRLQSDPQLSAEALVGLIPELKLVEPS